MKTFHLVTKQTHIAATTFDFKDYEDNSVLFMRIYKDSKWHDEWAALQEGDKFTLQHGEPVPVPVPVITVDTLVATGIPFSGPDDRPEMSDEAKAEIYS